jgi:hypothetical protein
MLKSKNSGNAAKSEVRGVRSGTDSQERWQQILDVSSLLLLGGPPYLTLDPHLQRNGRQFHRRESRLAAVILAINQY